ncbi:hypothetical protein RN607_01360 [Demequina capsici]|uniref:Uncharacterized protein n=1 Tax=Demequina capsici TaxID=3075620 RepID=A0AA96FD38_9MICO|nr:hypothetical protein [Demequina sp. PMTSA13]WNM27683.1 hypothetical protein RN607_01360 [Demequina sp. PMTSA13]
MRVWMRFCVAIGFGTLVLAGCGTESDAIGDSSEPTAASANPSASVSPSAEDLAGSATQEPSGAASPGQSSVEAAALSPDCTAADYTENDIYASPDDCAFIAMTVTITPSLAAAYGETDWAWADPLFEASDWYSFYGAKTPQEVVDAVARELDSRIQDGEVDLDRELSDGTYLSDYYSAEELVPSLTLDGDIATLASGVLEAPFFVATIADPTLDGDVLTLHISASDLGADRLVLRLPADVVDTNGAVDGRTVIWDDPPETMVVSFAGVSGDALVAITP